MKKDFTTDFPLYLALLFVAFCSISFIYYEVFESSKLSEDRKLEKITQCTKDNLGLKF